MTAEEFRVALNVFGLQQNALAARLGVAITTVNRWAQGQLPVPKYAVAYLNLLGQRPVDARTQRIAALSDQLDEWSVGTTTDNSADERDGLVFTRWPRKLRCEVNWPRSATGQAIAHELRKLADALEEADDCPSRLEQLSPGQRTDL